MNVLPMPESSIMNFKSTSESSRNSRIGFISGLGIELGGKGYLEKCTDLIELRLCDSIVTPIKENLDCARFVSCALLGI